MARKHLMPKRHGAVTSRRKRNPDSVPIQAQDGPLLNLPAEIRNRIWMLVMVQDDLIIIKGHWYRGWHKALPGILQASRQARKETLPIYLWQNAFQFDLFLPSKFKDDDFAGKTFGPHAEHLAGMRHLQFASKSASGRYRDIPRMVRNGDWSTVKVDFVSGSYLAIPLKSRLIRLLKEAMKRNRDGQIHHADLVSLTKLMSRKLYSG